ncbi:MAG: PaeR7I family type II restriction endonuclease [Prevotella sp.]|uniref:PaeR7I family type II restriction endonuclease n=1 Tax=Leyella stercorea TaxID=363265 RepID=UPI00242F354D|nr:PaeR7I family type II restriction endonuclease [Leyella stercorea]MCI7484318.1 PaeR7I family type II restriction endonuclease [Prevotella sp.]MDY3945625.1 PaeR7I family type II restriction endonuclease [Prevotella sp.]
MEQKYTQQIATAIKAFWNTKKKQGNVLAGKQLDAFLTLLTKVAINAGVPSDCIYLKNNHIPGYYRATKDWDLIIVSPKKNLVVAIELKSQVGSYGNNLNNRTEESLGSSDDFWTAFREKTFTCNQSPWLGYLMVVGKDKNSTHKVKVNEPHFPVRPEFKDATYLDRYRILCQRLVLEHRYNAVALVATEDKNHYENLADNISIETFINSLRGHLLGLADEFK